MTDFGSFPNLINPNTGLAYTDRAGIATLIQATQLARDAESSVAGKSIGGLAPAASIELSSAMSSIAKGVAETLQISVDGFTKALLSQQRRNRDDRVRRIHQIAGEEARKATLAQIDLKHPYRPTFVRPNRLAGRLRQAINDPQYFTARWDGLAIGNRNMLDRKAAHWYRLNYGVGERGAGGVRVPAIIKFFGSDLEDISNSWSPSAKPMFRPTGSWYSFGSGKEGRVPASAALRGSQQFIPGGRGQMSKKILTKGIKGSGFIDVGIAAAAKALGEGWTSLMMEWTHEASVAGTGPLNFLTKPQAAASLAKLDRAVPPMEKIFTTFETELQLLRYNQRTIRGFPGIRG